MEAGQRGVLIDECGRLQDSVGVAGQRDGVNEPGARSQPRRRHRQAAEAGTTARAAGGRIRAAGAPGRRPLESAAAPDGTVAPFTGETDIFITPGYRFLAVDGLMTNFHLPRSTLFMLVSALMGRERMRALYAHAIEAGYRFYSYGDASLLLPE